MTTLETTRSAPLGSVTTLRIVSFVERVLHAVSAWRSARATEKALAGLTDKQLRDIGLNRGDIVDVAEALARR